MGASSSVELRERIFDTAISEFRKRGYEEVSVSKITHKVGIAKGTFFNYFPTKDHVLSEALNRKVGGALGEVQRQRLPGSDAVLAFVRHLASELADDRTLAKALVIRLSELPGVPASEAGGVLREDERIRSWIELRLAETLPVAVPLVDSDLGVLAFLIAWTLRGSLEEWIRGNGEPEALAGLLTERIKYILESSGLPADV